MNYTQTLIKLYCTLAYLIYSNKYKIYPNINVGFEKLETESPAYCTMYPDDPHHVVFDVDYIKSKWNNAIGYIAMHEIAHAFENELNKDSPDNSCGGHNKLFIQLINDIRPLMNKEEEHLFLTRHIFQFLKGNRNWM